MGKLFYGARHAALNSESLDGYKRKLYENFILLTVDFGRVLVNTRPARGISQPFPMTV